MNEKCIKTKQFQAIGVVYRNDTPAIIPFRHESWMLMGQSL